MKYAVELMIVIDGNRMNCANTFYCGRSVLIAKVSNWVKEIIWEAGYRETKIERIIVNDNFDIAEEVNQWRVPVADTWIPF